MKPTVFLAISCCVFLAGGCGKDSKDTTYTVNVTLTKKGAGLKNVSVTLSPVEGDKFQSAVGVTDDSGKVTLQAQATKYKVVLVKQVDESYMSQDPKKAGRAGDPTKGKLPFPKEYGDKKTSPKEFEVKADGENNLTIDFK